MSACMQLLWVLRQCFHFDQLRLLDLLRLLSMWSSGSKDREGGRTNGCEMLRRVMRAGWVVRHGIVVSAWPNRQRCVYCMAFVNVMGKRGCLRLLGVRHLKFKKGYPGSSSITMGTW